MGKLIRGYTFSWGEEVTPQKLHDLVDMAQIAGGAITAELIADHSITEEKLDPELLNSIGGIKSLADKKIWVGEGTVPAEYLLSSDFAIDTENRQVSLSQLLISGGSYGPFINLSVDSKGRITSISNAPTPQIYNFNPYDFNVSGSDVSLKQLHSGYSQKGPFIRLNVDSKGRITSISDVDVHLWPGTTASYKISLNWSQKLQFTTLWKADFVVCELPSIPFVIFGVVKIVLNQQTTFYRPLSDIIVEETYMSPAFHYDVKPESGGYKLTLQYRNNTASGVPYIFYTYTENGITKEVLPLSLNNPNQLPEAKIFVAYENW